MKIELLLTFFLCSVFLNGQGANVQLITKERQRSLLLEQLAAVDADIELLKFEEIRAELVNVGLPAGKQIWHSAMVLSYAEDYEQVAWVAHVIRPEVKDGRGVRSDDFREDPLVITGSATEKDYFLKFPQEDGSFKYDGFGFDRGHLAPSADFRWSEKALSESFFYSNMSPQLKEFNREGWAELGGLPRGHVARTGRALYVVTGGVLREGLPIIQRGVNQVSIPEQFYKVVLDLEAGKAIGFLMPNAKLPYPIEQYAVSVDQIEALTGLDFFTLIDEQANIEAEKDIEF